jgi:hypothetical protein
MRGNPEMDSLPMAIAKVPWKEKKVAYGKADKVPDALVGLLSDDEAIRKRSYWGLDNVVVLQSDLYEAAYFVVPFLIRMLRERVPHGRDLVYNLLYEIANGHTLPTVKCRTMEGDEIGLRDACLREVNKGTAIFTRDLSDENPLIRSKAAELLELLGQPG